MNDRLCFYIYTPKFVEQFNPCNKGKRNEVKDGGIRQSHHCWLLEFSWNQAFAFTVSLSLLDTYIDHVMDGGKKMIPRLFFFNYSNHKILRILTANLLFKCDEYVFLP